MGSGDGCYGGRCRCLPLNFGHISVVLFTWIFVAAALFEIPAGADLHLAVATLCVAAAILAWQALAAYADGTLKLMRKSRALQRNKARLLAELQLDAHES